MDSFKEEQIIPGPGDVGGFIQGITNRSRAGRCRWIHSRNNKSFQGREMSVDSFKE